MRAFSYLTALCGLVSARVNEGSIIDDSPLVVLYYENWAGWIREFSPSHLENNFLSREFPVRNFVLNYAFFTWNPNECSMVQVDEIDLAKGDKGGWTGDDWNYAVLEDWNKNNAIGGHLLAFMGIKAKYPGIKLMPSIGGWSRSHTFHDCLLNKMDHMVESVANNIIVWGWDGVDLDWEYPSCDGAACGCQNEAVCPNGSGTSNVAGAGDWGRYKTFVKAMRKRFDTLEDQIGRRLYISAALGMNPKIIDGNNDVWSEAMPIEWMCDEDDFDFLNLMTYDFYGPWAPLTGPLAPLYPNDQLEGDQMSISESIDKILARCSRPYKLNMGLATYGKSWSDVPKEGTVPGLWQQSTNANIRAGGTYEMGTLSYFDVKKNYLPVCTRTFDDVSKTPTLYCATNPSTPDIPNDPAVGPTNRNFNNVFISYEDGESWKEKMSYARSKGLGGAIIWASSDTGAGLSWCPESTVDLMSGLFEGWFGQKVAVNDKANGWKTSLGVSRFENFPCPLLRGFVRTNTEIPSANCNGVTYDASKKYLNFKGPSSTSSMGVNKQLVHPIGGGPSPTNPPVTPTTPAAPTVAPTVPTVPTTTTKSQLPTTQPQAPTTTARSTSRCTRSTTTQGPATTTLPECPEDDPTDAPTPAPTAAPTPAPTAAPTPAPTAAPTPAPTAAPTPAPGGDAVADCQAMLHSSQADWLADCKSYCAFIWQTAWCTTGVDGQTLAQCVIAGKPYCTI